MKRHPLIVRQRDVPLEDVRSCLPEGGVPAKNPWECRKYCMEMNEWRYYIAAKLQGMIDEWDRLNLEKAAAAKGKPLPDWSTETLPAVRKAIADLKPEMRRRKALEKAAEEKPEREAANASGRRVK
jgi:hypothetical protein